MNVFLWASLLFFARVIFVFKQHNDHWFYYSIAAIACLLIGVMVKTYREDKAMQDEDPSYITTVEVVKPFLFMWFIYRLPWIIVLVVLGIYAAII